MEPLIPPFWFLDREQNPIFLCTATVLVAAYIDQRADDKQTEALGAIFTGVAGGPMAALAPLIGKNLGVKKVPITYRIEGKKRSAEIPGILNMSVDPLPTNGPYFYRCSRQQY